jgi:hypothetical protein
VDSSSPFSETVRSPGLKVISSVGGVGRLVGTFVGLWVGAFVGGLVGGRVGCLVGCLVGGLVGAFVRRLAGARVGGFVGAFVGTLVGPLVGTFVGASVGNFVGDVVRRVTGVRVVVTAFEGVSLMGALVGETVGDLEILPKNSSSISPTVPREEGDGCELISLKPPSPPPENHSELASVSCFDTEELELPDFPEATAAKDIVTASSMTRDAEASANVRGRLRMNATQAPVPLSLAFAFAFALVPVLSEEVPTGSSWVVKDGSLASVSGSGSSSLFGAGFSTTCLAIV